MIDLQGVHLYAGVETRLVQARRIAPMPFHVEEAQRGAQYLPQAYATFKLGRRVAVGLALDTPSKVMWRWASGSEEARTALQESLFTASFAPSVSVDLEPYLAGMAVGASLRVVRGDYILTRELRYGDTEARVAAAGSGFGIGGDAGARWRLPFAPGTTAGVHYQSAVSIPVAGAIDIDADPAFRSLLPADRRATGRLRLPQALTLGAAHTFGNLEIEIDVSWRNSSQSHTEPFSLTALPSQAQGQQQPHWQDTLGVRLGATYDFHGFWLQGGAAAQSRALPKDSTSPAYPQGAQRSVTLGVGYLLPFGLSLDASVLWHLPSVTETPAAHYRTSAIAALVGVGAQLPASGLRPRSRR